MSNEGQKNIIFVLSDQHNPQIMGNAGDSNIRTPNMDRLAVGGTSLTSCYCGSPLCIPSRSAMLTGQLPPRTGVYNNFQALRSDEPTFAHSLTLSGYETVLAGRMHFRGADQRHGFLQRLVGDNSSPYVGYEFKDLGVLDRTTDQHRIAVEKSGPGNSLVIDYDQAVLQGACDFLENYQYGKPLFMTVGFFGPHCPYVCPKELYDYYYETLPIPEDFSEFKHQVHPAIQRWYVNRDVEEVSIEEIRKARAGYYGLIELMDQSLGAIIEKVDQTIGLKNTLFIYASDHGDMIGDKGLFWKTNFYEGSARIPILFHLPGVIHADTCIDQPTSLLDLGPTFLELAGGVPMIDQDGESILALLTGKQKQNHNRAVFSLIGDVKGDSPSAMIRKAEWKLISHYGYNDVQLFNLKEDPLEMNDLGRNRKYSAIREQLLSELQPQWNGDEVMKNIQRSKQYIDILKQWTYASEINTHEEWWTGGAERNFIL